MTRMISISSFLSYGSFPIPTSPSSPPTPLFLFLFLLIFLNIHGIWKLPIVEEKEATGIKGW